MRVPAAFVVALDRQPAKRCGVLDGAEARRTGLRDLEGSGIGSSGWRYLDDRDLRQGSGHTLLPVGNPGNDLNGDDRLGDNLYTDSIVALDPGTGKLKWYFQFTPHDVHDFDAMAPPHLWTQCGKEARKLMVQGQPQWIPLCAGPHQWQVSIGTAIHHQADLGKPG